MRPWNFPGQQRTVFSDSQQTVFAPLDSPLLSMRAGCFESVPAIHPFRNVAVLPRSTLLFGTRYVLRAIATVARSQHGLSHGAGASRARQAH
jgi:hypothetical protein